MGSAAVSPPAGTAAPHRAARAGAGVATLVLLVLAVAYLRTGDGRPATLYRDEAGIVLDAALVSETGRDYHGELLPLYFRSFEDWKSAPYVYLLAGLDLLTGPSERAARLLSAVLGLAAAVVLGLTGRRLTGATGVGVATALLAAATPWLFEVSRLVFEVSLLPLLMGLVVLQLAALRDQETWPTPRAVVLGATLGLYAYSYAGGRALSPLLAASLLVFASGRRRRGVAVALVAYAVTLLPMAVFVVARPRALLERFGQVDEAGGTGPAGRALAALGNLARELDLVSWSIHGDQNLRHHVAGGGGSLLVGGVLLAVLGVVVLVRAGRWDRFWSWLALAGVAAAVPAAISDVRLHALRSVALPVVLVVLAVPALDAARRARPVAVLAGVLGLAAAAQVVAFQVAFRDDGPDRRAAFHADLPDVLRAAYAAGPVAVYADDPDALGGTTWVAHRDELPLTVLAKDAVAPPGTVLVTSARECPGCERLAEGGIFVAHRVR